MGGLFSSTPREYTNNERREWEENRIPIITPRHVPRDMVYPPAYEKFNIENYKEKFAYPVKEVPKYW